MKNAAYLKGLSKYRRMAISFLEYLFSSVFYYFSCTLYDVLMAVGQVVVIS